MKPRSRVAEPPSFVTFAPKVAELEVTLARVSAVTVGTAGAVVKVPTVVYDVPMALMA